MAVKDLRVEGTRTIWRVEGCRRCLSGPYQTYSDNTTSPGDSTIGQGLDKLQTMVHSQYSACCLERYTMQKKIMVRMPRELHDAVKDKAEMELRPVAAVVRRLLEKWLRGEIDLDKP
jgi:predicted HicB family RNase H-like nuclease